MNCLNVFDHFVGSTLKGLSNDTIIFVFIIVTVETPNLDFQIWISLLTNFLYSFRLNIYLFKVNDRNTRKMYEIICSKLTIKTSERH